MGFLHRVAIALSAISIGCVIGSPMPAASSTPAWSPIVVQPGDASDIVITKQNSLNATNPNPPSSFHADVTATLPLQLVNEIQAGPVTVYVTGLDSSGRLVFVQSNGQFYYPTAQQGNTTPQQITANIGIPLGAYGSTTTVTIPNFITSGRVYTAVGQLKFYTIWPNGAPGPTLVQPSTTNPKDPNAGVKWGFVELTNNNSGIYANLSFVDFVGLVLGMSLKNTAGKTLTARGLKPGSLGPICDAVKSATANDGQPWANLCMTDSSGNALRIIGPQDYLAAGGAKFNGYWTNYINSVMSTYSSQTLTISTPSNGNIACKTVNGALSCAGDNHPYGVPIAADIFGCASGPFQNYPDANAIHQVVSPILCAAYNRATLLLKGGNVQPSLPPSDYYQSEPNNVYSKIVHSMEVDGRGYAFPYDDVTVAGGVDQSGALVDPNPQSLTIYVGGQQ